MGDSWERDQNILQYPTIVAKCLKWRALRMQHSTDNSNKTHTDTNRHTKFAKFWKVFLLQKLKTRSKTTIKRKSVPILIC